MNSTEIVSSLSLLLASIVPVYSMCLDLGHRTYVVSPPNSHPNFPPQLPITTHLIFPTTPTAKAATQTPTPHRLTQIQTQTLTTSLAPIPPLQTTAHDPQKPAKTRRQPSAASPMVTMAPMPQVEKSKHTRTTISATSLPSRPRFRHLTP